MKILHYEYSITYGNGQGLVIAESKEEARQMIVKTEEFIDYEGHNLRIYEEINPNKKQVIDFSWQE